MAEPKGFAPWNPRGKKMAALSGVLEVIKAGRDDWPLSQRYWLYRLMGTKGWEKFDEYSAKDYRKKTGKNPPREPYNLNYILNRARRAHMIPWEAVSCSRGLVKDPSTSDSPETLANWLREIAEQEQFDRQAGQDRQVVLWLEAEGLVETMARTVHEYGATLLAGQGFDVVGRKHAFAKRVADCGHVLVLHAGDLDKSGHTVKTALMEDLDAFIRDMGGQAEFKRILLTEEQVHEYGLAYTVATKGLNAGNHGKGFTSAVECQLEAMDIADIRAIVKREFEAALDMDLFNKQVAAEDEKRREAFDLLLKGAA